MIILEGKVKRFNLARGQTVHSQLVEEEIKENSLDKSTGLECDVCPNRQCQISNFGEEAASKGWEGRRKYKPSCILPGPVLLFVVRSLNTQWSLENVTQ